ncbi:MAG: Electron transfer flavoprotein subunit alpha [Planctomycetes bacterium]|nr:Electron transfer flavoprotein subunit alpha [Planctomycetota bacterium]
MSAPILVFLEHVVLEHGGAALRKPALEGLGAARAMASQLGAKVIGVVVGGAAAAAAATAGADEILVASDPGAPGSMGAARAVAAAARECGAAFVIFPATARGRDLLALVAGHLAAGVAADAVKIDVAGGEVRVTRPVYAGKALQVVVARRAPFAIGLRPNAFAPAAPGAAAPVREVATPAASSAEPTLVETRAPEVRRVDLTEAAIVVSGGRGMKGPENFHLVESLAAALGGVVGASRAVVDAGWRPHGEQVGQTGKTVSPKLYVACGISGAIQHLAGMSSSKCIVAINRDREAPIFKVADFGIVGDCLEVLPALTAAVQAAK